MKKLKIGTKFIFIKAKIHADDHKDTIRALNLAKGHVGTIIGYSDIKDLTLGRKPKKFVYEVEWLDLGPEDKFYIDHVYPEEIIELTDKNRILYANKNE